MRFSSAAAIWKPQRPPVASPTTTNLRRAAEQTCLALLQACASLPGLFQVQAFLLKSGLHSNTLVLTKFTSTCSSFGGAQIDFARSLLFSPEAPVHLYDAFLFNTLIRGCAETHDSKQDAVFYFSVMLRQGVPPNKFTFPFLLKACAGLGCARAGVQIHASAVRFGFHEDPYVMNTLVHMYASSGVGSLGCARKVFDDMLDRSTVSWSAMIGGYVRCGLCNEAVSLFRKMQIAGVQPDDVTLITVLSACADLGALELAKWIGSYIEREKIPKTLELCNAFVNTLAKCGDIDGAGKFFDSMPERSIITWTSVIDGHAMHGHGQEAIDVFQRMVKAGVFPDDVTFLGVLSACSHAGMVEEGVQYFEAMKSEYHIAPKIEHYGCMVDCILDPPLNVWTCENPRAGGAAPWRICTPPAQSRRAAASTSPPGRASSSCVASLRQRPTAPREEEQGERARRCQLRRRTCRGGGEEAERGGRREGKMARRVAPHHWKKDKHRFPGYKSSESGLGDLVNALAAFSDQGGNGPTWFLVH